MDNSRGFHLLRDGNAWVAVGPDFVDLQRSPTGFGETPEEAIEALHEALRLRGVEMLPAPSRFKVHSECPRAYDEEAIKPLGPRLARPWWVKWAALAIFAASV